MANMFQNNKIRNKHTKHIKHRIRNICNKHVTKQ